jgi:hypothetical protein
MAGFAVNLKSVLEHPELSFRDDARVGYLESIVLETLGIPYWDLEVKAKNATEVSFSAIFSPYGKTETLSSLSGKRCQVSSCLSFFSLQVYVWHTRAADPKLKMEAKLNKPSSDGFEI